MIFYKNVDICDIISILARGILSLDECGNNNWDGHYRANNPTSKVYLFRPIGETNSFPSYGVALVEVDIDDAVPSIIGEHDAYFGQYEEYICDKVEPKNIKAVYVPRIFKNRMNISTELVSYVEIEADYYDEDNEPMKMIRCPSEILKRFAETAPFKCSTEFNFFRGVTEKRTMIDLYNVRYII